MLRRGGFTLPDVGRDRFKNLPLLQHGERSICILVILRFGFFQSHAVEAFHFLPSGLQYGFPFCREGVALAVQNRRHCLEPVRLGRGRKQPCGDQRQYIPFPGRQLR